MRIRCTPPQSATTSKASCQAAARPMEPCSVQPGSGTSPLPAAGVRVSMKAASVASEASASRLMSSAATSTLYRQAISRSSSVPDSESRPMPVPNNGASAGAPVRSGRRVTSASIWRSWSMIRVRPPSAGAGPGARPLGRPAVRQPDRLGMSQPGRPAARRPGQPGQRRPVRPGQSRPGQSRPGR